MDTKTWVYKDWDGNVVRYPNGYPDFSSYVKQEVKIPNLKGNHSKSPTGDFGRADALAPNGKADYSKNTWHHHEDKVTMQEMPKDTHNRFTHCGGVSGIKKG
ncbi:HNH endonuclease [Acinetobacter sp. YH12207]|uniref:HNH endonuclease n=1 Tax=unclassified Acinetobacter TaxID=196816 RepID=UPI0035A0E36D